MTQILSLYRNPHGPAVDSIRHPARSNGITACRRAAARTNAGAGLRSRV